MWPADAAAGATLYLCVGADRVDSGALRAGRWDPASLQSVPVERQAASTRPIDAASAALRLLQARLASGQPKIKGLRVIVDEVWLAIDGIPWSDALLDDEAGFARAQLMQAGFLPEPADRVRLDDAAHGQPRLAVAFPADLMQALQALADAVAAPLESVLPQAVAAWPLRRARHDLLLLHGNVLTLVGGQTRVHEVSSWPMEEPLAAASDRVSQVAQRWQRSQRRAATADGARHGCVLDLDGHSGGAAWPPGLHGLDLPAADADVPVPATLRLAWSARHLQSPLDAVPAPPRHAGTWRLVAGLAAVLLAGLSVQALQVQRQMAELSEARGRTQQESLRARRPEPVWTRDELAQVRAVNAAVRALNLPLSALLAALQPPKDLRVAVLGLDLAPSAAADDSMSTLRVSAEARTGAEMARYVAYLGERPPFSGALLVQHEVVEQVPGNPFRFTLEASWRP